MSKKLLFVFNPISGKAHIKNTLFDITDSFTKGGYDVTLRPTQGTEDAYNFIKNNASEFDLIVISGGDGTLNEAVRALMTFPENERKPLGYIPSGTTNDFAMSRGIPKAPLDAAKQIVEGNYFKCDIGHFNDRYFTYVAAFGAFTSVSYDTPQETKNILGHAAYLLEGLKLLSTLESYRVVVHTDECDVDDYFFLGLILNSTSLAGFNIEMLDSSNSIDLSDGLFEIVLIKKPVTVTQFQEIFNAIINGESEDTELFRLIRTSKAKIISDEPLKWTLDGEFGGEHTHIDMEVLNKALTLV